MIKHLDENAGQIFSDINHSSFFLAQSPKATEMIANINKQNLLKIISFYIANKMKIQHVGWEKIFANDADKGLISKIHIYLLLQFLKKYKNMGRRPNQTSLQRRHSDGQQAHEKMFNITKCSRNTNENYNEVLPNNSQTGHHQKVYK